MNTKKIKDMLSETQIWVPWLFIIVLSIACFACFYVMNIYYPQKIKGALDSIDADATPFYAVITNYGKTGMVLSPDTLDEIYESEDLVYGCKDYRKLKSLADSGRNIEDKHVTLNYDTYCEGLLEFKVGLAEVKYSNGEYYVIKIIREL